MTEQGEAVHHLARLPVGELPSELLSMLAAAVPSAPRGGTIRLRVTDGSRDGTIAVNVEEARAHLGMASTWSET